MAHEPLDLVTVTQDDMQPIIALATIVIAHVVRVCEQPLIASQSCAVKHTFGGRLRSAGVSFEDRQDLLGHKSSRITTHYSTAELLNLWEASNKVCDNRKSPTLVL